MLLFLFCGLLSAFLVPAELYFDFEEEVSEEAYLDSANLLYLKVMQPKPDFMEFTKGFLIGLSELKPVEGLKNCLKSGDELMLRVNATMSILKEFKLASVKTALTTLHKAMSDFMGALKPCMGEYKQLLLLTKNLATANIAKLALKIMKKPGAYVQDVRMCLSCFKLKNFLCVGNSTGHLMFLLLLSRREAPLDPLRSFLKGFLEGIRETKTIADLDKCLQDAEPILRDLKAAMQLLKHARGIYDIVRGMSLLINSSIRLVNKLQPCVGQFQQLQRLIDVIFNSGIDRLIDKLAKNPLPILMNIIEAIRAYSTREYDKMGLSLGDMLYRIYLAKETPRVALD